MGFEGGCATDDALQAPIPVALSSCVRGSGSHCWDNPGASILRCSPCFHLSSSIDWLPSKDKLCKKKKKRKKTRRKGPPSSAYCKKVLTHLNPCPLHLIYLTPEKLSNTSVIQQTAAVRSTDLSSQIVSVLLNVAIKQWQCDYKISGRQCCCSKLSGDMVQKSCSSTWPAWFCATCPCSGTLQPYK